MDFILPKLEEEKVVVWMKPLFLESLSQLLFLLFITPLSVLLILFRLLLWNPFQLLVVGLQAQPQLKVLLLPLLPLLPRLLPLPLPLPQSPFLSLPISISLHTNHHPPSFPSYHPQCTPLHLSSPHQSSESHLPCLQLLLLSNHHHRPLLPQPQPQPHPQHNHNDLLQCPLKQFPHQFSKNQSICSLGQWFECFLMFLMALKSLRFRLKHHFVRWIDLIS
mmetsp:Transcript_39351/g.54853  ORF Transcript_39351/g.54853 Transcript_39351/m.54853 type:complete len:220 (+) Transcript_39351:492-1151(+)